MLSTTLLSLALLAPGEDGPPADDLVATYRSGQVFLSWSEDATRSNESYRIYRSDQPITSANLASAQLLYQVWEGSSRFWADSYFDCIANPGSAPGDLVFKPPHVCATGQWQPRFVENLVIDPWTESDPTTKELGDETGVLVWTLQAEDLYGPPNSYYYYAVTTVLPSGLEIKKLGPGNTARSQSDPSEGPEAVAPPKPVKIAETYGDGLQYVPPLQDLFPVTRHVYVQYLDLREFNPTLAAPNLVEHDYGVGLATLPPWHALRHQVQYAFPYVIVAPTDLDALQPDLDGLVDGSGNPVQTQKVDYPPEGLPVVLRLHAGGLEFKDRSFFENTTRQPIDLDYYVPPAIEIRPIDVGGTGWFGFARAEYAPGAEVLPGIDYRDPSYTGPCSVLPDIAAGAPIVNYTEQRVLRMVADLFAAAQDPDEVWYGRVDTRRTYVIGHSMGGNGTIALAARFPNVFAAGYAHAAATDLEQVLSGFPLAPLTDNEQQMCELFQTLARKWGPPSDPSTFHAPCGLYLPCMPGAYPPPATPVEIDAPNGWADHLAEVELDGVHVWEWQDHGLQLSDRKSPDAAPLGMRHSTGDDIVLWPTQGSPFYDAVNESGRTWGGLVDDDAVSHLEFAWYNGLPETLAEQDSYLDPAVPLGSLFPPQPFHGYGAKLDESVPGLTLQTSLPPAPLYWSFPAPQTEACYNAEPTDFAKSPPSGLTLPNYPLYACDGPTVEWNASWNTDLRAALLAAPFPGPAAPVDQPESWGVLLRAVLPPGYPSSTEVVVDVTPRRLQQFQVAPGNVYTYELVEHALSSAPVTTAMSLKANQDGLVVVPDVPVSDEGTRITLTAKYGAFTYGPSPAPPTHALQLDAAGGGQLGAVLQLEVSGLTTNPAVVTLGIAPFSLQLFGGTLLVDPTKFTFPLPAAVPGSGGLGQTGLPIPADPSLVGVALYFQASAVDLAFPPSFLAFSNGLKVLIAP